MNEENKVKKTAWTQFMDMHSGGGQKLKWAYIYIEAPSKEAEIIFYNRFGRNPHRVTCTCCGDDYSVTEVKTLERITAYNRGCRWDDEKNDWVEEFDPLHHWKKYQTLEKYKKSKDILIITKSEIKDEERKGEVPEEGYVWQD